MRVCVLAITMLGLVGCSSGNGGGSTSRRFDVSFEHADAALRDLYPPALTPVQTGHVEGSVTIKRDELSHDRQEKIVIGQVAPTPSVRTDILLDGTSDAGCEVSVQVSKSKKTVLLPSRDKEAEQRVLDTIAEALNKK